MKNTRDAIAGFAAPIGSATAVIDINDERANMYGCLPCPKCGSLYRWPNQQLIIFCDDCKQVEVGEVKSPNASDQATASK